MNNSETFKFTTSSDREISITRVLDAPRAKVFEALSKPELIKRWLLGPPGWSMPVCDMDFKEGGHYRWVWRSDKDGTEMGMGGVFREIVPPERFTATEKFDQAWYPGEAVVTNSLIERNGATELTLTIRYESQEARDIALKTDMQSGVGASYDRLEEILASQGTSQSEGAKA